MIRGNLKYRNSEKNISTFIKIISNLLLVSFLEKIKSHDFTGIGYNFGGISIWEDDSHDLTGWHDAYFDGYRFEFCESEEKEDYRWINSYDQIGYYSVSYLTQENTSEIIDALEKLYQKRLERPDVFDERYDKIPEFVNFIKERFKVSD